MSDLAHRTYDTQFRHRRSLGPCLFNPFPPSRSHVVSINVEPPKSPMSQQPFGRFALALLRFPKLVVAAVNGPAVGVGVTLLPHCDIVYAYGGNRSTAAGGRGGERPAYFWTPFFRLAIVPEFCSSVTFPEILVSGAHCVGSGTEVQCSICVSLSLGVFGSCSGLSCGTARLRRLLDALRKYSVYSDELPTPLGTPRGSYQLAYIHPPF